MTHRHAFVRITKLQNKHTKILRTAVTPQGCIYPRFTRCFGQDFCFGISKGAQSTRSSLRTAAKTNSVQRFHILQHRNREGFWSISESHHTDGSGASRLIMLHFLHVCLLQPRKFHFCNNPYGCNTATDAAHHSAACRPSNDVPSPQPSLEI